MKVFVSYLILPIPVFLLLVLVGILLLIFRKRRAGKVVLLLAAGFFLLVSTPFVPEFMAHGLERQYSVFDPTAHNLKNPYVMVLGAGHSDHPSRPASVKISQVSSKRLMEGVRLYYALPEAKLITSAASYLPGYPTHAEVNALAALELQVDPQDTLMLVSPTTQEEAIAFAGRFGTDRPLILVTSATHMPRAMMLFTAMGVRPIAAPTDFLVEQAPKDRFTDYLPNAGNVVLMEKVIHEYVGMVWAMLLL